MLAIRVVEVVRIERDRGGQEVCDLREARRVGCGEAEGDGPSLLH